MSRNKKFLVIIGNSFDPKLNKIEFSEEVKALDTFFAKEKALDKLKHDVQYIPLVKKKLERAGLTFQDLKAIDSCEL